MRTVILAACLMLAACSSRESGGTVSQRAIAPCPVMLLPIADSTRRRVRVFGSGAAMQAAVIAALRGRGFAPTVATGDDATVRVAAHDAGARLVLAATFLEYEPDLALYLQLEDIDTGDAVAEAVCVTGSTARHPGAAREEIAALAGVAVGRLVSPTEIPAQVMRPAFKN